MDTNLNTFVNNNDLTMHQSENGDIILENAWHDDSILLRFDKDESFDGFENLVLNNKLVALYHSNPQGYQFYEFIFQPILNTDRCIGRKFSFNYEGHTFEAEYKQPTEIFEKMARSFRRRKPESESNFRNLILFRDYYDRASQKESIQKYFQNRTPINFYLSGSLSSLNEEQQFSLMKHLNFYMQYYDRESPIINILKTENPSECFITPCKCDKEPFPTHLNLIKIDNIVLSLLQTARSAESNRLGYIFYYQVLEYCAYYYMDAEFKRQISTIIKQPDLYTNWDKYLPDFIEKFQTNFNPKSNNSDSLRMDKVICEYCTLQDINEELTKNSKYFLEDQQFDGGFKAPPLLPNDKIDTMDIRSIKLRERLEKIRNVLVHARESRENCVILPSEENENKLLPYLYLIRRIAETVAFRYDQPLVAN